MEVMTIGKFKSRFASVLELVRRGQEIVISYGKKREKVAVLVPYRNYGRKKKPRSLGCLSKRASYRLHRFSLSDEEFLSS